MSLTVFTLFSIVFLHLLLGISILFHTHYSILRMEKELDIDLRLIRAIKKDLILLTSPEQSSAAPLFNQLLKTMNLLSHDAQAEQSWKLIKATLSDLATTGPGNSQAGQEIQYGLIKCRILLDELGRLLIEKHQRINGELLSRAHIYGLSWVLITICLTSIGIMLLTKLLKKRQKEVKYFEGLADQFKSGALDRMEFNYSGRHLIELNRVLADYVRLLKERYHSVKTQIKNLNFQTNEISLFSKQNETICLEIKQDLARLIDHTYQQFDKYRVITEGIRSLNLNLGDSKQQILNFRDALKRATQVFQKAPEVIKETDSLVKRREEYLKNIINRLDELQDILDKLFQTGSVFQNVAEQNNLLALNASIEAARADTAGGEFDFAALEIARLAEKTSRVSKELLVIVDLMGTKGKAALKALEQDLARNIDARHFIEVVGNKINDFCDKAHRLLDEASQYSAMIGSLEDKQKSLEELTESLSKINQRTQNNYGRAGAALEVIQRSGEVSIANEQLDRLIAELERLMDRITV